MLLLLIVITAGFGFAPITNRFQKIVVILLMAETKVEKLQEGLKPVTHRRLEMPASGLEFHASELTEDGTGFPKLHQLRQMFMATVDQLTLI